ncbi:MAG: 1-acyl-sn-glycerol-3-phosphate acyltransferase [Methylococcaceae bacterium]|nr:1-acyl-sn-glycerol-3-phosphate acyltransferase [Methylococcaceae bacterium]
MSRFIKIIVFAFIIKPLVLILLGLNIRNRHKLPLKGAAIIAANHNSHLDTLVLMSLYPLSVIHKVRPVAAADYFLKNRFLKWLSLNCIGIIPFNRSGHVTKEELFAGCHQALDNGDILILFPEGSRGDPEKMSKIKKGLFYLIKDREDTQVTPVVMRGLGKALPKGEALFVPFNCDVIIGDELAKTDTSKEFIGNISASFAKLFNYCLTRDEC